MCVFIYGKKNSGAKYICNNTPAARQNNICLLQNIVSFIGLFCKRDLLTPAARHTQQNHICLLQNIVSFIGLFCKRDLLTPAARHTQQNHICLLQNIVSFIGLFCKRDLLTPAARHTQQNHICLLQIAALRAVVLFYGKLNCLDTFEIFVAQRLSPRACPTPWQPCGVGPEKIWYVYMCICMYIYEYIYVNICMFMYAHTHTHRRVRSEKK